MAMYQLGRLQTDAFVFFYLIHTSYPSLSPLSIYQRDVKLSSDVSSFFFLPSPFCWPPTTQNVFFSVSIFRLLDLVLRSPSLLSASHQSPNCWKMTPIYQFGLVYPSICDSFRQINSWQMQKLSLGSVTPVSRKSYIVVLKMRKQTLPNSSMDVIQSRSCTEEGETRLQVSQMCCGQTGLPSPPPFFHLDYYKLAGVREPHAHRKCVCIYNNRLQGSLIFFPPRRFQARVRLIPFH